MFAQDGNLHLHRPFLDRLAQKKPDAPCSLAAFLLLNVVDGLKHADFDADALSLRINAAYNPLATMPERDPQVGRLVKLAESLRGAVASRSVNEVIPSLVRYADWLAIESRFKEGLSVIDTATYVGTEVDPDFGSALLRRKGYMLRLLGFWDAAEDAYSNGMRHATDVRNDYARIRCQNGLALILLHRGMLNEGMELLTKAVNEAERTGLSRAEACASHDLAIAGFSKKRYAFNSLARAYELYDDYRSRVRTISDLARFFLRAGYFAEAKLCSDFVKRRSLGMTFRAAALGTELWLSGQTGDRRSFDQAIDESGKIDGHISRASEVDIKLRIGQGYILLGEPRRARPFLIQAREIAGTRKADPTNAAISNALDVLDGTKPPQVFQIPSRRNPPHSWFNGKPNTSFKGMFRLVLNRSS